MTQFTASQRSTFNNWPTKDKAAIYKIQSFWMNIDHSLTSIERETYSILEWFGDVGGLFEGLKLIAAIFMTPLANFAAKSKLLTATFKKVVTLPDYFLTRDNRHRRMVDKNDSTINKQLDLINFVKRQRMLLLTALFSLNSKQKNLMSRISSIKYREEAAADLSTSSNNEIVEDAEG